MPPLIFGHRGASAYAPENTLIAFQRALELGADGVELDVTLSADGVPVVIHDDTVDRTTDGHGRVNALTLEELKQFDAGHKFNAAFAGERIPTLREVFEQWATRAPRPAINIELKKDLTPGKTLAARVVELIHHAGWAQDVIVSSFDFANLRRTRALDANLRLGALYVLAWRRLELHRTLTELQLAAMHPPHDWLTAKEIRRFQAQGYQVNTWTVNSEAALRRLCEAGVDGLITNYPDRAVKIRAQVGAEIRNA
jgi:glycerophosphoryl diester phosphodiesterase